MSSEEKDEKKKKTRRRESFSDISFESDEYGGRRLHFGGSQPSFSGSVEEMSDEEQSRSPPDHLGRINKGPLPVGLQAPRTKTELDQIKGKCDCIILRLDRLPIDPTTKKEIDGEKFRKSIFGQQRDFSAVMDGLSAYKYLQQRQDKSDREKNLLSAIDRDVIKGPEWLHSIADCLGGPVVFWNGAAGSHAANTQMLAIESAIKARPGIGVEVSAYTKSGSRVAEFYEYKVFAYGDDGKPVKEPITFIIDAQRQWYNQDDWNQDVKKITDFLKSVEDLRSKRHCLFELPEIIQLDLAEGMQDPLRLQYLEPGPVFVKFVEREDKKDKLEATFTNSDDGDVIEPGLLGHNRYSGYRERMLEKYPFHREAVMLAIQAGDLDTVKEVYIGSDSVVEKQDAIGNGLAHYAAKYGNLEIINDLIAEGVDLTIANHNRDTPLHLAAKVGHISVVKTLCSLDAFDVDVQNEQGDTPLHLAIKSGNLDLTKFLWDKSTNIHVANNRGETAYDLAIKYKLIDDPQKTETSELKATGTDESAPMDIDQLGDAGISAPINSNEEKLPVPESSDMPSSPQLGSTRRSAAPLPILFDDPFGSSSSEWKGSKTKTFDLKRKAPDLSDDMDEVKDPRDEKKELKEPDAKKPRLEEKKTPDSDDEKDQQSSFDGQSPPSPRRY